MPWLSVAANRALLSLTTVPNLDQTLNVVAITVATTITAGLVAAISGFIDPIADFDPPYASSYSFENNKRNRGDNASSSSSFHWSIKPLSTFLFPSLVEEVFWRGILIAPHPSTLTAKVAVVGGIYSLLLPRAGTVLVIHVVSHPLAGWTIWPRGRKVFCDSRFLLLATIVLGGATASYLVSGGSVWAAALSHGLPVALWRDFFGGEAKLMTTTIEKKQ